MTMKNKIKALKSSTQRDSFEAQWQSRQQWQEQAEKWAPDDKTFLQWVEKAQQDPAGSSANLIPIHRNKRWIPYAAAASLVIGVAAIGLTRQSQPESGLPVAEEVTVESQTIHFICNNGCSAQDIMFLANKVIK
jgi:hypothetical protein